MATVTLHPSSASDPAALQAVIMAIESSGNLCALRFEPSIFDGRAAPITSQHVARLHGCDLITGHVITATSWGLFQIMGFNLYSGAHPWTSTVFDFLNSPSAQIAFFQQWLTDRGMAFTLADLLADPEKLNAFAEFYNGNAQAYAPAILREARALGFTA